MRKMPPQTQVLWWQNILLKKKDGPSKRNVGQRAKWCERWSPFCLSILVEKRFHCAAAMYGRKEVGRARWLQRPPIPALTITYVEIHAAAPVLNFIIQMDEPFFAIMTLTHTTRKDQVNISNWFCYRVRQNPTLSFMNQIFRRNRKSEEIPESCKAGYKATNYKFHRHGGN